MTLPLNGAEALKKASFSLDSLDDVMNYPERKARLKEIAQAEKDEKLTREQLAANQAARAIKHKLIIADLTEMNGRLKAALQERMQAKVPETDLREVQVLKERLAEVELSLKDEKMNAKRLTSELHSQESLVAKSGVLAQEKQKLARELDVAKEQAERAQKETAEKVQKLQADVEGKNEIFKKARERAIKAEEALLQEKQKAKEVQSQLEKLKKELVDREKKDAELQKELDKLRKEKSEFDLRVVAVGAELRSVTKENDELKETVARVRDLVSPKKPK